MRRLVTAAATVALAAMLAACGSSGSTSPALKGAGSTTSASSSTRTNATSSTTATTRSGTPSPASGGAAPTPSPSVVHARISLAQCFRSHGVDVPNPTAGGQLTAAGRRALQRYPRAKIAAAFQACGAYAAHAFTGSTMTAAQRTQLVKFAACLRSHGIKLPKLAFTGNGLLAFRLAVRRVDRNSASFRSALSACRSLVPRSGR